MAQLVVMGAMCKCSFGVAPSSLSVINPTVSGSKMPVATIMDSKPMVNIMPFGMCQAPTNPMVIAATAAAAGVFTPAPCIPAVTAPWIPGSPTVTVNKMPALNSTSTAMCTWLGVITITNAGQVTITVP